MNVYATECRAYRAALQARIPSPVLTDDTLLIEWLRSEGCGIQDSIVVVREVRGISLGAAKDLVSASPVWDDRRAADAAFHELLIKALANNQPADPAGGD